MSDASDWTTTLAGPGGEALAETLRGLELGALQKLPVPKARGTLPFGQEWRVLREYLRGGSATLYESAFAATYRGRMPARVQALFEAFVLNEAKPRAAWDELLGKATADCWAEDGLLVGAGDALACPFQVIPTDDLVLLTDSKATANSQPEGANAVSYVERPMHEYLARRVPARAGRALDVGPGAGLLTLDLARTHDAALGLDLNPRAARVAAFNVRLNGVTNCEIREQDIFDASQDVGRFETVTWNTPLLFLPEELKDDVVMAYGGDMGIEITLRFLERLPDLMTEDGVAHVASAAPILTSGANFLLDEVRKRCPALDQDVTYHRSSSFWGNAERRPFYRSKGIARFEGCWLEIRRGSGRLDIGPTRPIDDAVEWLRRMVNARR